VQKIRELRNHSEPWVTTTELAEYWQVSRKQIYKQIDAGTLKAIRLGPRLLRISTTEALRFEEAAKISPSHGRCDSGGDAPDEDEHHGEFARDITVGGGTDARPKPRR
jgi:excisionase family DNA binding protein